MDTAEISERSRGVALTLSVVTGVFGGHRFYLGRPVSGVAMLLTFGGLGIWYLYDCIVVAAGEMRDGDDRRVRRWGPETVGPAGRLRPGNEVVFEAVDALRDEVADLQERVDFMERMLVEVKERPALPGGVHPEP